MFLDTILRWDVRRFLLRATGRISVAAGGVMAGASLLLSSVPSVGATGISFRDIAAGDGAGITYRRVESPREAIADAIKAEPYFFLDETPPLLPIKGRGAPGVALLDYDGDGDVDMYVTNGPGVANSLYSNQLAEAGMLRFVDMAMTAGVGAADQDSNGVCAGDIDNDWDMDLLVLGAGEPNRLFENQGDGTFEDITTASEIGGGYRWSASCSMGDIDGDGLLDIVVANTTSWESMRAIIAIEPFALNEHNQLFRNEGGNRFVDISATSGMEDLAVYPAGAAGVTWAVSMVDYDLDGDVDIVLADDQATFPPASMGGVDRGTLHIFDNDGTGSFQDVSLNAGVAKPGDWMGLAFSDFNCDGSLDLFATNGGDYAGQLMARGGYPLGLLASRWLLGAPDNTFDDPGVGDTVASVFGWGTGATDYDNDGDADIIYHGGLTIAAFVVTSPAAVLRNQGCSADFERDFHAVSDTDHVRRNVQGLATGDLNDDGFDDVVTVSNFDIPEDIPLLGYPVSWGSPFDDSTYVPNFFPTDDPNVFVWSGFEYTDGTLSVEINSGDNGNRWAKVIVVGSIGLTRAGRVNRNGVGAVVSFTPKGGPTSMRPVVAGSSYQSQDSLEAVFGMGSARRGTVDVLWPGGVRNRLYRVRAGERVVFPEIPCSFDDDVSFPHYVRCVSSALAELTEVGALDRAARWRFFLSAIRAFYEHRTNTSLYDVQATGR